MASLSLPRVLQLKKNSLDAEREQFEKFQTLAIQKAINSVETPVKEKHVRSTIIGTFQEQSAVTYWMVAIRLPLQDNRIVAWKFCHVTHKVLREGHPACLDDSRRHTGMIENLGKLWVHLREGYGRLVHLYCQLLVTKIQFHARNPRFPPSLSLTAEELDAIAENDVNNYFQLCVELFDYMDDILNLQAAVFDSLGNARANSMTASGQCRLAALIPCAQDSSQIYDCNVRILFRLHASLPADTLSGHRERFGQQFKKLSSFYKHASSLQYYRNLLSLPVLPSNPPNFLLQSDFGTYVAPVVSIPEPSPEEQDAIGSLIDTSDTMSQMSSPDQVDTFERPPPSPQPDPVLERDRLIDHLQGELRRMRSEVQQLMQERNAAAAAMRDHCSRLEGQLHATKTELQQEKQKADLISAQTPEIKQKLTETEEKAKLTDEKFQKLKGAYTQLREEHISLIRQKAEVDKLSASLRAAAAEHESAKMALQQQLNDKVKDVELLQQSASSSEEVQAYKNELTSLRAELELSRQKDVQLETLRASMETLEIEHKTAATEAQEKINNITSELKDVKENFENIKKEKEDRETELSRVKEELVGLREKSGEEYTKAVEEKEAALKQIEVLKEQFQQEKQDLLQGSTALEERVGELTRQLVDAQAEVVRQRLAIVSSAGSAAHQMATTALSSLDGGSTRDASRAAAALAATAFEDLARHKEVTESPGSVARAAVLAAHSTAQLATYVTDVANVATDMAVSDKLTSECRSLLNATVQCMESLSSGASSDQSGDLSGLVREMLVAAVSADRSVDGSRSVDDELADMDTAIEDAARQIEEMLAASRKGDSGVKLEVNSKILDACTTLMAAVKVLVQDARQLQGELGDAPARRVLYRRNPQWSDGLISAAKAVVFAAKLLVSSADEAVSPSGSGRSEGVSAAAHEVAGSTAQLVAASRVRSAPASPALARLTQASRHVAAATGAVVAAVRAGSALITDQEALDTSKLTLTAARRLEMESKVRTLELEVALEAERRRLAALRKRHYQLDTENGGITNGNGKE
ncbi:huntingtin-interacting protein 1 isoform X4 [Plutella xylostella]|uniref:huntingtin-interacting protein 1 isoform X4 n=1 Tax=Plutella xylostella TaxID=51655 RepID=UPI00203290E9|nr:huntingtin-interacting protein 1 isoform X4 [Plutella xylostella]